MAVLSLWQLKAKLNTILLLLMKKYVINTAYISGIRDRDRPRIQVDRSSQACDRRRRTPLVPGKGCYQRKGWHTNCWHRLDPRGSLSLPGSRLRRRRCWRHHWDRAGTDTRRDGGLRSTQHRCRTSCRQLHTRAHRCGSHKSVRPSSRSHCGTQLKHTKKLF